MNVRRWIQFGRSSKGVSDALCSSLLVMHGDKKAREKNEDVGFPSREEQY